MTAANALQAAVPAPGAALSLRRNFSWTLAGNVVRALSQWGMLSILAKLGSTAMVGQFALGLAVTAPIFMFSNMNLRIVQATDARREFEFCDYIGVRILTTGAALFAVAILVMMSGYRVEAALVIAAIAVSKAVETGTDVFHGLFQQRERMDLAARSDMIRGPLSLVVLAIAVYVTGSVLWGAIGLTVAWVLSFLCFDYRYGITILGLRSSGEDRAGRIRPRWIWPTTLRILRLTLPMGIVALLVSLMPNVPRYFVERQLGEDGLGIFAALAYILVAGHTVVNALARSATPRLANYYAAGELASFRALLVKLAGVGLALGVSGIALALAVGRPLLTLLYTPEYALHVDVFVWVMVAGTANYVAYFLWAGITAARYLRVQVPMYGAAVIASAVASRLLVPQLGLLGGALALLAGALILLLGTVAVLAVVVGGRTSAAGTVAES